MSQLTRRKTGPNAWATIADESESLGTPLITRAAVPQVRDEQVVTIFPSGHGWTAAAGSTGSLTDDTDVFLLGDQSLRITTPGDGGFETARKTGLTAINGVGWYLAMTLRIDRPWLLDELRLDVSSDTFTNWSSADTISPTLNSTQPFYVEDEWVTVVLPWGAFATGGGSGATRSAITAYQIRASDNGNGVVNVWANKVCFVPEPPQGAIVLTFDDGWVGQYENARPIMDAKGFRGVFAPIIDKVDEDADFMTLDQLHKLADGGHEIAVHAYDSTNHGDYPDIDDDVAIADALRAQAWTVQRGMGPAENFIVPEGAVTSQQRLQDFEDNFVFSRGIYARVRETWPVSQRGNLRTYTLSQAHNVADVEAKIDEALLNNELLVLQAHNIVDANPTSIDYTTADFQTIMDYIAGSGGIVRTLRELEIEGIPQRPSRADIMARGQGLKGQNYDRSLASNASVFVSGTIFYVAMPLLKGDIVSNIYLAIQTAGSAWTTTLAKAGVVSAPGGVVLSASANKTTDWDTIGLKTAAQVTPYHSPINQTVWFGFIIVGSGTTAPAMARATANANANGAISPGIRPIAALTGQTDLVNGTVSSGAGIGLWCGWS